MTEFGGPEVLELAELPTPEPGPGEVLIRVTRAGLNFADTHTRTNSYVQKATLPLVPGGEVAGVREDTGERVVALVGSGGYAEYAIAPARARLPDPRRGRRRHGARADHPGDDRVAPVPHRRARGGRARASSCTRAAGGVGSLAVQLGQRARRRARDRDAPRARRSARWRSSSAPTRRSTPTRRA